MTGFAIGTDTMGSARRPTLVNDVFELRPNYDAASPAGIVPVFIPRVTLALLLTRDVRNT